MASDMPYRDFARKFRHYGVQITTHKRGSHVDLRKVINGEARYYPVPLKSGRWVKSPYVRKARRTFDLLPENGVSDEQFDRI